MDVDGRRWWMLKDSVVNWNDAGALLADQKTILRTGRCVNEAYPVLRAMIVYRDLFDAIFRGEPPHSGAQNFVTIN